MKPIVLPLTVLVTLGAGAVARVEAFEPVRVTVPFSFHVGKTTLPAGTYTISSNDDSSYIKVSGNRSALLLVEPADPRVDPALKRDPNDELVFVKKDDSYQLLQVWNEHESDGVQALRVTQGRAR